MDNAGGLLSGNCPGRPPENRRKLLRKFADSGDIPANSTASEMTVYTAQESRLRTTRPWADRRRLRRDCHAFDSLAFVPHDRRGFGMAVATSYVGQRRMPAQHRPDGRIDGGAGTTRPTNRRSTTPATHDARLATRIPMRSCRRHDGMRLGFPSFTRRASSRP